MDWQVLAALAICGICSVAWMLMGSDEKPPKGREDEADRNPVPMPPSNEPITADVDAELLARFTAALQQVR